MGTWIPWLRCGSIDLGLKAGASYLEIYEKDIDNPAMQDTLGSAHAALWHSG